MNPKGFRIVIIFTLIIVFSTFYFSDKPAKAVTVNFSVNWSAGFEGFSYTQTSACGGVSASCTSGRVNDSIISTNVLFVAGTALAVGGNNTGYFSRTLTWQTMGVPANAEVKSVTGSINGRQVANSGGTNYVGLQIFDSANTTNAIVSDAAVVANSGVSTTWGTFSGSSVNVKTAYEDAATSVTIRINMRAEYGILLSSAETRAHNLSLNIVYELPSLSQDNWRTYTNADSTNVGSPLASQNTTPTLTALDQDFRLRMTTVVSLADLVLNYQNYKLQYVDRGNGTCASPSGGTPSVYSDVSTSTLIAYNNNPSVADGATLTTNANDPTITGGSVIVQTYEELNNFSNSVAEVIKANAAMWDFSLTANGADPGKTFCFRIVKSDNSLLESYVQYPSINTITPYLTIDLVDSGGSSISSPQINFTSLNQSSSCKNSTATFGASSQKIRVSNITTNPSWNMTLQASDGSTDRWENGSNFFDYNDPTANCQDGADSDSLGGQLSIGSSSVTTTPFGGNGGCTNTGISLGNGSFSEGVTNIITLANASGSANDVCEWDFTGYNLTQSVPAGLPIGNYSIQFTLSVIAN